MNGILVADQDLIIPSTLPSIGRTYQRIILGWILDSVSVLIMLNLNHITTKPI
jgi:hypothetical protein